MSFAELFGFEEKYVCIADQEHRDGRASIFHENEHKKSLNKYEFIDDKKVKKGGDVAREPKQIGDRSKKSREAYREFLEGLRQINQQEYLLPDQIGNLKPGEKFDKDCEDLNKVKDAVPIFSTWLRTMEERAHAYSAQLFHNQLLYRSRLNSSEKGKPPQGWASDKIPIRPDTAKYLARPPEYNYTFGGMIVTLSALLGLVYTLIIQILTISSICSVAFFCPTNGLTDRWPVVAPPVSERVSGANIRDTDLLPLTNSYADFWKVSATNSCTIEDTRCKNPGYLVQWPYIQTANNSQLTSFPAELRTKCEQVEKGDQGWVFDPFSLTVLPEYWDCGVWGDILPFRESASQIAPDGNVTESVSDFHFDTMWYRDNHAKTLDCMRQYASPETWEEEVRKDAVKAAERMKSCMRTKTIKDNRRCQCDQYSYADHPIKFFYVKEETGVCDGGENEGALCSLASNQTCLGEPCVAKYSDQLHVSHSNEFGCFFTSPTSEMAPVDYFPCGFSPTTAIINQLGFTLDDNALKQTFDVKVSRRMALLIFFICKEASLIPGAVLCVVICIVGLLLLGVARLVIRMINQLFGFKTPEQQFVITSIVVSVKDAVRNYISIIWFMFLNFSTTYRIIWMGYQIITGDVNISVKDMEKKLTSLSNAVYNLVLLVALSESEDVDPNVMTSLVITLFLLLLQMNTEMFSLGRIRSGLADLNENRLTKFEAALLWVKIMEDFLVADVQFNFVQLFNSDMKLKPFADLEFPDVIRPAKEEAERAQVPLEKQLEQPIMSCRQDRTDMNCMESLIFKLRKITHDLLGQNEEAGVYYMAMRNLTTFNPNGSFRWLSSKRDELMVGHDKQGSQFIDVGQGGLFVDRRTGKKFVKGQDKGNEKIASIERIKFKPPEDGKIQHFFAAEDGPTYQKCKLIFLNRGKEVDPGQVRIKDENEVVPVDDHSRAEWEWTMLTYIQEALKGSTINTKPEAVCSTARAERKAGDKAQSSFWKTSVFDAYPKADDQASREMPELEGAGGAPHAYALPSVYQHGAPAGVDSEDIRVAVTPDGAGVAGAHG